jgi:ABC-type bacteriocin/lantibiotic exporter with double-glycine peptidase domain
MALLQVLGIASILPFMQLVAQPESIYNNEFLLLIQDIFGATDARTMLIITGTGVLILVIVGNLFSGFTVWLQHKYAWEIAHSVSTRLLDSYLKRPYDFFLNIQHSVLLNKSLIEVGRFVREVLIPIIDFLARISIVLVISVLLIWVNPKLALIVIAVFSAAYLMIYAFTRRYLSRQGEDRTTENEKLLKSLNDVLAGIKAVKIYEAESFFYRRFESASSYLIKIYPRTKLIAEAPRYLIEIIAFGGILSIILFLLINSENVQDALPVLSLYALAAYRLLPALQKAFAAASSVKHSFSLVDGIYEDLHALPSNRLDNNTTETEMPQFSKKIELVNIDFKYRDKQLFKNLSLSINQGSTIGIVGSTGSGKSTLIDLIVGLLKPQHGLVKIDNSVLDNTNVKSWNHQIGYVPQEVFLFDDTIARNIALGLEDSDVDMKRVENAAKMAEIHDFIVDELPLGYQSNAGERGFRLSGGERQRIGLARAFYRLPKLLILDEATSALDNMTESAVIESLSKLSKDLTVIIIAHRLSTVKNTDRIILLQEGKIIDDGDYHSVSEKSGIFREMSNYHNN